MTTVHSQGSQVYNSLLKGLMMSEQVITLERPPTIGVGTVVTLKSGGPAMVVIERTADKASCVWHKDDGDMCRDWVPLSCLKVKP